MGNWTDLLVRVSPSDSGQLPAPGEPYTSPDIICVQQNSVSNPSSTFTANYSSDPNLPVIANQNNLFYTRAKNLGSSSQGGRMFLYWTNPSLLMTPSQWLPNALYIPLTTPPPNNKQFFCDLPAVAAGAISVQPIPFVWSAPGVDHICMVGICSTSQHPWNSSSPPTFANWQAFVDWVRNNGNVGWRNLQMVANPNIPEWDTVAAFNNEWNASAPLLISAQANANVLANTTITIKCTALGINTTGTIGPNGTFYAPAQTCPANFQGVVETIAQTPNNAAWPSGATLITTAYLAAQQSDPVSRYAHQFGSDENHPHVQAAKYLVSSAGGVLVEIGNNSVGYQPSL